MMAWAVITKDFEYDFRPERPVRQAYKVAPDPVQLPERIVAFAVAKGCAERADSPSATRKRAEARDTAGEANPESKET